LAEAVKDYKDYREKGEEMSITVKLIEPKPKPKPKFNVGDVVRSKNNTHKPFEIVKVEKAVNPPNWAFMYWDKYGSYEWEEYLELHEEEKKEQLTFGDVSVGNAFIDKYGRFCVKIRPAYVCNAVVIHEDKAFPANMGDEDTITRILDGIEITEVRK
jgi:hypothetical protein